MVSKNLLFTTICLVLLSLSTVGAYDDYQNEFNDPGEQGTLGGSWIYLTKDGIYRQVDVYRYCSPNCIHVIFDVKNNVPLDPSASSNFFESFLLKNEISSGKLTETMYAIDLSDSSITCNYMSPKFIPEANNYVIETTSEKIIPEMLPQNSKKVFLKVVELGKGFGIIKEANVPILVIGASCIGSDLMESSASSTLNSCKSVIQNIRVNATYEGQAEDLIGCHNQAILGLNSVRSSPDNFYGYLETSALNLGKRTLTKLQTGWCSLVNIIKPNSCSVQNPVYGTSTYERLSLEINGLQRNTPNLDINGAQKLSTDSSQRIERKRTEVSQFKDAIALKLQQVKMDVDEYSKPNIINDILFKPYDFTEAKGYYESADRKIAEAEPLIKKFKFNSASPILVAADGYASQANLSFQQESSKVRELNPTNIFGGLLIIVVLYLFKKAV